MVNVGVWEILAFRCISTLDCKATESRFPVPRCADGVVTSRLERWGDWDVFGVVEVSEWRESPFYLLLGVTVSLMGCGFALTSVRLSALPVGAWRNLANSRTIFTPNCSDRPLSSFFPYYNPRCGRGATRAPDIQRASRGQQCDRNGTPSRPTAVHDRSCLVTCAQSGRDSAE
jgi:hypothetical protein